MNILHAYETNILCFYGVTYHLGQKSFNKERELFKIRISTARLYWLRLNRR